MRNWTVAEAVATINAGKDTAGIKEITTHFPMFALAAARGDLASIAAMMPEKMTLRRLQQDAVAADVDVDDDDESEIEEAAPKAKSAKAAKNDDDSDDGDYESMTKDQLIALCVDKGLKVAKHQKPKQYYIDALNAAGDSDDDEVEEKPAKKAATKASAKKTSAAKDEDDDEEDSDEYAGKSAKELFQMCKDRGIKVQPRQASRVYIEALKAEALKAANDDPEEEGWGDEDDDEAVEEKPAKKTSGKAKAKAAKAEDDEEEDWDI